MRKSTESGLNLIEVVVALALLAAVLLSVSTLFIQGSQSVNTGRDLTEATSLANDVLEEMDKWGFSQLYTNFGKAGTDTAFSVDTKNNTYASRWQAAIDQRLPNAKATITITPLGGAGTFVDAANSANSAKAIRTQVTVTWTLTWHTPNRSVTLETVRY